MRNMSLVHSPLSAPVGRVVRSPFGFRRGGAAAAFNPASLFGGSDKGSVFDLTDSAKLFQLSGGTTAVAINDPIGYVKDDGPQAKNALQATAGSRPIWQGIPKTLGAELATNGRFATDTDWTKGTGWTIASNTATKAAGTASTINEPIALTAGKTYLVQYLITRTAGTITPQLTGGTTVAGTARSYGGSYTELFTAVTGNTTLEFSADAAFAGTLKNVTVKEVIAGVVMGAKFDGVDDFLQTATNDFSASDKATMIVSLTCGQSAAAMAAAEFSNYLANTTGSFELLSNSGWAARARGTTGNPVATAPSSETYTIATYQQACLVARVDLAGAAIADQVQIGVRGISPTQANSGTTSGGGSLANGAITIGRAFNNSLRWIGLIHRVLVINRKLTPSEEAQAIAWATRKMPFCAVIGDSTSGILNSPKALPQAQPVAAFVGGMICGAADISNAGDRIADQLTKWNALPDKSQLDAVTIQIGLNDVKGRVGANLATTAQVIADLQALVDKVNTDKPAGCKTNIAQMTPCKAWLDLAPNPAAAYAAWQDVNTAIAGGGATPITGVDRRITGHVAALSGAGDILHANYDMDGVHESDEARVIIASYWRAALEADGLM
jgi:lysophospholipase L1-like esterase